MLDFVTIGFIVLTILVIIFAVSSAIDREQRSDAARKLREDHPHVATAIRELGEHPRIGKAVRELQDAIAYMEGVPHDFGGHRQAAITNARTAIEHLRKAIVYRAAH
jgi:hypothetical protein